MRIKNTKAQFLYTDWIVFVFALVIIFIMTYLSYNLSTTHKENFETLTPDISYQFPRMFILGFLNTPLDDEDTNKYFSNKEEKYYVKDLIWCNSKSSIELALNKYKQNYLESMTNSQSSSNLIELYERFSKNNIINSNSLIQIYPNLQEIGDLSQHLKEDNFVYVIQTSSNLFTWVSFKGDSITDRKNALTTNLPQSNVNCIEKTTIETNANSEVVE